MEKRNSTVGKYFDKNSLQEGVFIVARYSWGMIHHDRGSHAEVAGSTQAGVGSNGQLLNRNSSETENSLQAEVEASGALEALKPGPWGPTSRVGLF